MLDDNLDVQRLMHEIRATVASGQGAVEPEHSHSPVPQNGQLSQDSRFHVNDLLKFHGDEFIRNAYRALLCREPDEAGMAHHLDGLASGRFNKIDVLASLHSSPEGRNSKVQLDGLALPVTVRRLGRIPLVGYFIRLIVAVCRLPLLVNHQNQFEFYTWSQQRRIVDRQDQQHKELNETLQQISAQLLETTQRAAEQQQANELSQRQYEQLLAAHQEVQGGIEARLSDTRQYIDESTLRLSNQTAAQLDAANQQLLEHVQRLVLRQQKAEVELLMQERRLRLFLEQVRPNAAALNEVAAKEEDHLLDGLYASFEDQFRGPRDEVQRRLAVYVPIVNQAQITSGVLDVGCGRGEWLQLLKAEGIEAQGVDRNRVFIEECRHAGLDVIEEDALIHLRSLPDESLNAVTTFHLVEHVPFEMLINLIDEVVRVLKPEGMLIVETPNPENFMVGSCNFYADPTHRNPIPSETLQFLLGARGLDIINVLKLRPWDEARIKGDSEIVKRFNEYFYSAPDYGIIARKPLLTATDVQ